MHNETADIDPYSYILENSQLLERWSGKTLDGVVFDTQSDGSIFPKHILASTNNVYVVLVDYDANIFGFYMADNNRYTKVYDRYYSMQRTVCKDIGNVCIYKSTSSDFIFSLHSRAARPAMFHYKECVMYDMKDVDMRDKIYLDFFCVRLLDSVRISSVALSIIVDNARGYRNVICDDFLDMIEGVDRDCFPRLFALKRIIIVKMSD